MKTETMEINRFPANADREVMLAIAENYAAAIVRRGREATDSEFLAHVWAECGAYYVAKEDNFLILYKVGEIFIASHFAPATVKGGVRLLQAVEASGLPIVFAVPEDLARNLKALGWKQLPKFARVLAAEKGLPDEKEILVPAGLVKRAWTLFKSFGDVFAKRDQSPAPVADEGELEKLAKRFCHVEKNNKNVALWWAQQTKIKI